MHMGVPKERGIYTQDSGGCDLVCIVACKRNAGVVTAQVGQIFLKRMAAKGVDTFQVIRTNNRRPVTSVDTPQKYHKR